MRLVVGYYDLPQNASKPRPPPPTHVTVNNLQALRYTKDVDPYYKLALLSYRSKLENTELVQVGGQGRAKGRAGHTQGRAGQGRVGQGRKGREGKGRGREGR